MYKMVQMAYLISGMLLATPSMGQLPKVQILTTGGTIASQTNAPSLQGNHLIEAVPQLTQYASIQVEEISRVGSSKLTPTHWIKLAQRIQELLLTNPEIKGFVITHGTDSMEETAYFLNLVLKTDKPVVLVGSMRASNELSADGPANLLNAIRVAVHSSSKKRGVLVAMNEQIFPARDLVKMYNRRTNAFSAARGGVLGIVEPDTILYYYEPNLPHTVQTPFSIQHIQEMPSVAILQDYIGLEIRMLEAMLESGLDGLVISSFAGGRLSREVQEWVNNLSPDDLPVVISSSILEGRITGNPQKGKEVIIASDLKANKARILLMLGLSHNFSKQELTDAFETF